MDKIATREAFGNTLLELGEEDQDFMVLDADISRSTCSYLFHDKYPERALNLGLAEQNMMGVAAGLAASGIPIYATTYAVFASMRALEQIRTFICYPDLNVKIIASHGGLQVSSDGATHQGLEDIAIMRSLANMTVVHPADVTATKKLVKKSLDYKSPLYIRLMRNPVSTVYEEKIELEIGKGVLVQDEPGADCTIIATGLMVGKALKAASLLRQQDIKVKVLDIHTIKPIDEEIIIKSAQETGAVVTAEDHNINGGLGSAVAEVLGENYPVPLKRIGVPDVYGESGDPEFLFTENKMNTEHIAEAVHLVVNKK
ncbi:MAG: transketolase family protein [Halanaerobiaceae bacterium]